MPVGYFCLIGKTKTGVEATGFVLVIILTSTLALYFFTNDK